MQKKDFKKIVSIFSILTLAIFVIFVWFVFIFFYGITQLGVPQIEKEFGNLAFYNYIPFGNDHFDDIDWLIAGNPEKELTILRRVDKYKKEEQYLYLVGIYKYNDKYAYYNYETEKRIENTFSYSNTDSDKRYAKALITTEPIDEVWWYKDLSDERLTEEDRAIFMELEAEESQQ